MLLRRQQHAQLREQIGFAIRLREHVGALLRRRVRRRVAGRIEHRQCGRRSRARRPSSKPFIPGMTMSVNSRSMSGWRSTMSSACEPLSASMTVNCSSFSIAAVTARTPASSSTSRIVRSRPEISVALRLARGGRELNSGFAARQIQPHARAPVRRALDLHVPARLLDEAVHHAEAEPRARDRDAWS